MADSPETAVALSDDDLDELVVAAAGEETTVTEDPEPDEPAPAEADQADDSDAPESPTAGGDEDEDVVVGDQAPAALPAAAPVGKPFQYKASGGVHTLAGALELPDGSIVVPKDSQSELRTRLASERELATNFKALRRESDRKITALKAERTDKDVEADAVIALFTDIQKMTPDERWEYFEKFDQEVPRLKLEVEKKQLARDRKAYEELRNPTPTTEERQEQRSAALETELAATYKRVMESPAIKALTQEEVNAVFRKHAKRVDRLVSKEGEDEVFDDSDVLDDLKLLIDMKGKVAAVSSAKEKNDRRNADTNAIPPVVTTRAPSTTPKPKGEKTYKGNPQKFKNDFMSGKLDSD